MFFISSIFYQQPADKILMCIWYCHHNNNLTIWTHSRGSRSGGFRKWKKAIDECRDKEPLAKTLVRTTRDNNIVHSIIQQQYGRSKQNEYCTHHCATLHWQADINLSHETTCSRPQHWLFSPSAQREAAVVSKVASQEVVTGYRSLTY